MVLGIGQRFKSWLLCIGQTIDKQLSCSPDYWRSNQHLASPFTVKYNFSTPTYGSRSDQDFREPF